MKNPVMTRNFEERPLLVFWETTRACGLVCKHCRAESIDEREPEELDFEEGRRLIESVADFGAPTPMIILTGGDVLLRPDLFELIDVARAKGVRVAVSPSVTPLLNREKLGQFVERGVKGISISLDGSNAATHDGIRAIEGTYHESLKRVREGLELGMRVQINTAVMKSNVHELPDIFHLIKSLGVRIWEVFFLIHTGRGAALEDLEPWEYEEVSHFLYEASFYGVLIRTTEAPFFRRVLVQRMEGRDDAPAIDGKLLGPLKERLVALEGEPDGESATKGIATGDGRGIVFVSHRGDVYPSGYLTCPGGNVRQKGLVEIYRDSALFKNLRNPASLKGRCGKCSYAELCGGSRARAYASFGDPLAEDTACVYQPNGA